MSPLNSQWIKRIHQKNWTALFINTLSIKLIDINNPNTTKLVYIRTLLFRLFFRINILYDTIYNSPNNNNKFTASTKESITSHFSILNTTFTAFKNLIFDLHSHNPSTEISYTKITTVIHFPFPLSLHFPILFYILSI